MQNKQQKNIYDCDSCSRKINIAGNKTIKFIKWMLGINMRNPSVYMTNNKGPTCLICLGEKIEKECNCMRCFYAAKRIKRCSVRTPRSLCVGRRESSN